MPKREKENFESLDKIAQAKLVNDMTRYFIFKGMAKGSFLKSKVREKKREGRGATKGG